MIETLFFVFAGFLLGSLPFSVWIGRWFLGKDIRAYGDGNPGTFNVIRAGGLIWGGLVLLLDMSKGAITVGLASQVFAWDGLQIVVIALAPVFGHAFSPFLRFRGGKAIATTGGVWIGLTLWRVPLVGMVALTFWYFVLTRSGWAVMFTLFTLFIYLLLWSPPNVNDLLIIWILLSVLLIYKHRVELNTLPAFRIPPPLLKFLR